MQFNVIPRTNISTELKKYNCTKSYYHNLLPSNVELLVRVLQLAAHESIVGKDIEDNDILVDHLDESVKYYHLMMSLNLRYQKEYYYNTNIKVN